MRYAGTHAWDIFAHVPAAELAALAPPLADRVGAALREGRTGSEPRRSASIVPLRERAGRLEVWAMRRHSTMVFGGAWAFPGGKLEPGDATAPDPIGACAVRELAEETGCVLAVDELVPWARWITPEPFSHRFDATFFLACPGERELTAGDEAVEGRWMTPDEMLFAGDLLPPARALLRELLLLGDSAAVRAAAAERVVEPVLPRYGLVADELVAAYPRRIDLVRAPNPGPMTLDGTNTWVIHGPSGAIVVDPGPCDADHLAAIDRAAAGPIVEVWLTHHHHDHSEAAGRFGVPVRAYAPELSTHPFVDGEELTIAGPDVRVHHAPGHTADSVLITVGADILTGDTVLGRGPSVIAAPDGDLGDYLTSLEWLRARVATRPVARLLPGHGPIITDPVVALDELLAHRHQRLDQVRQAVAAGARTPDDVVDLVYGDIAPQLRTAALASAQAQLAELARRGGAQHH